MRDLSVDDLAEFLLSKQLSVDIVYSFKEHGIDGQTFLMLTEDHLKEIAPRIADRVNLKTIVSGEQVSVAVHSGYYFVNFARFGLLS